MWFGLRKKLLLAFVAVAAIACALLFASEARRKRPSSSWAELSLGLGLGSQAGIEAGFFAYDSRQEAPFENAFTPLPGVSVDAGPGGVFTLQPRSR